MRKHYLKSAAYKIALIYLVISAIWILLTDYLLLIFIPESDRLTDFQNYKGFFFILFTAYLLYIMIHRHQVKRKKYELDLEESNKRYKSIFEESVWATLIIDPESGTITDINKAGEDFYGMAKSEMIGKPVYDLDLADHEQIVANFNMVLNGQKNLFYLRHQTSSGEIKEIESYASQVNFNGKNYIHTILHDITPLRKTQHELIESKNLLQNQNREIIEINQEMVKANQELDSFVYRVSHDLRAPLTSCLGLSHLIQQEQDIDVCHQYAQFQKKSLIRLDQFIVSILDYTRNVRTNPDPEPVDLQSLINAIYLNLAQLPEYTKIKFQLNILQDNILFMDKMRLNIILNNLITNAFKFHNDQIEEPKVEVTIDFSKTHVLIIVRDNGIGIPVEHIARVYDMFYRANDRIAGSGIGLYIVKDCLQKLNGNISLSSVLEQGTEFQVAIPLPEKDKLNKV